MSKRWAQILPTTSRKFGSVFRDPTEPKLRYSVNSVRFGRTLMHTSTQVCIQARVGLRGWRCTWTCLLYVVYPSLHTFYQQVSVLLGLTKALDSKALNISRPGKSITSVIPYDPVGKTNKKNISNVIQHANDSNCIMNGNKSIIIIFLRKFEPYLVV